MKTITSTQNIEIKSIAALQKKQERSARGMFVAEGIRTCSALIDSPIRLVQLYATENLLADAQSLAKNEQITLISEEVLKKISGTQTPSGLVGVFKIPKHPKADQLTSGIVLAQIADPGNMGTLIRSAAALNARSVVVVEGADVWSPKVVQATAGTIGQVDIFQWDWPELLENKQNVQLCALVVHGGRPPHKVDMSETLLVIGNEAHGLPNDWVAACEHTMTLAMPGKTESLNAAVAGSIALYISKTT
jgi:TrmH family RNA methyltransferase